MITTKPVIDETLAARAMEIQTRREQARADLAALEQQIVRDGWNVAESELSAWVVRRETLRALALSLNDVHDRAMEASAALNARHLAARQSAQSDAAKVQAARTAVSNRIREIDRELAGESVIPPTVADPDVERHAHLRGYTIDRTGLAQARRELIAEFYEQKRAELRQERAALLAESGLSEDDL